MHIRGFAPFGSGHRFNKREAKLIQETIFSILEESDKVKLSRLDPFVQNHQVTFNTRGCSYDDTSMLVDRINLSIAKHNTVQGPRLAGDHGGLPREEEGGEGVLQRQGRDFHSRR